MAEDDDAEPRSFLADECTFTRTVRRMRDLGRAVNRVQDLGMAGASDATVFQKAQENEAVLVTTDRGFGDVRAYPPSSHRGIIVLKVTRSRNRFRLSIARCGIFWRPKNRLRERSLSLMRTSIESGRSRSRSAVVP